jgi:hypothetical protein
MKKFILVLPVSCCLSLLGCASSSEQFVVDEKHPAALIESKDSHSTPKPFLMSGNAVLTSSPVSSDPEPTHSGHSGAGNSTPPPDKPTAPKAAKEKHDHHSEQEAK